MIWLYRVLFLPGLLLALPYYALRMWRRGGYGKDFQHRLGRFQRLPAPDAGKQRIWLQAVSVGEVLAVGPLIEALQADGRIEIVLTTTTSTGYAEARKRYTDKVRSIGIFPLDFWLFTRLAWRRIQPDAILLTEGELWPEHLHQAKKQQVPVYLINARMSDTSFKRYSKLSGLAARLLNKFNAIFAASAHDARRLEQLGAQAEKIHSTGSIKLDVALAEELDNSARDQLLDELGFRELETGRSFILLGASTWPGEESILIELVSELRKSGTDLRLLLVPRHAERGPEIRRELEQQDLAWHQRTSETRPEQEVLIYLADTTGELSRLTQLADLAFIGKSLPPNKGGQTPIEAAGQGIPVLMGPNMNNFKTIAQSLVKEGAAQTVADKDTLKNAVRDLLADATKRETMSRAGQDWHARSRGSSQRIANHILQDLQ